MSYAEANWLSYPTAFEYFLNTVRELYWYKTTIPVSDQLLDW